jgi:hypothetical protein
MTEDFGAASPLARRLVRRRGASCREQRCRPDEQLDHRASIPKSCRDVPDGQACGGVVDLKARPARRHARAPDHRSAHARLAGGDGDHNGGTFVSWMAGAGVRGGAAYGTSDEWSWKAAQQATTTYDFHATVLHLLGINHEKLTFRHNGADRRLTDVHGEVIQEVLA